MERLKQDTRAQEKVGIPASGLFLEFETSIYEYSLRSDLE